MLNIKHWILNKALNIEYEVLNIEYKVLNIEYKVLNIENKVLNVESEVLNLKYWILNTKYWILNIKYWILLRTGSDTGPVNNNFYAWNVTIFVFDDVLGRLQGRTTK